MVEVMAIPRAFLPGIQVLRALAATLVVIEHAGSIDGKYTVMGVSYIVPYFSFGRIGVILFFAISGFVIALQREKPVVLFISHRLMRIYPSYWIATLIATALLALVERHVSVTPASMLLYPSTTYDPSSTIPYWTLVFEITFYALAAVAFALRFSDRFLTVLAVVWILAVNLFGQHPATAAESTYPGSWILMSPLAQIFPIGLICGIHFKTLRLAGRWPYAMAAALAFAVGIFLTEDTAPKLFTLGIFSACIVIIAAEFDMRSRLLSRLGDASYGIYLLHSPMIIAASLVLPHSDAMFFAVGMAGGTVFGMFDYWLYRRMPTTAKRN